MSTDRIVRRVLAEGDFVVNHSVVVGAEGPAAVRFDLWRLADNTVIEHWTDEEHWAANTANGHTQIDGSAIVDHTANTDETRRIATAAVQTILVDSDTSSLEQYLAGDAYVQHNPRFTDGVSGFVSALGDLAQQGITMTYNGIRQVVAEGNFAYLRSEGSFAGEPFIFHDLFRVADGRCVEHWDVMVPATEA